MSRRRSRPRAAADEAAARGTLPEELEDRAVRFIMGTLALLPPASQARVFHRVAQTLEGIYQEAASVPRGKARPQ